MPTKLRLDHLQEDDVRAIVRLLAAVVGKQQNHEVMKSQLMGGLCKLIQADSWVWSLGCELKAGQQPVYLSMAHGGLSEDRYAKLLCGVGHSDMAKISAAIIREMQKKESHVTRLYQQVIKEKDYLASGIYPHMCAADIGPFLVSLRPIDEHSVSTIALYRRLNQPNFTERESRMTHIVLTEVSWLHEQGWPMDRGVTVPRLSPRERLVLNMLLDGRSRKDIAENLSLTEGTIAGYQKVVYRHFSVNSHPALMRRFQSGDGGHQ